jgi:exopolysaccharide production protein ExoQ
VLHLPPFIASILCLIGIVGLFVFGREPEIQTSPALWLPLIYFLIVGSRPVSIWLGMRSTATVQDIYMQGSPVDRIVFLAFLAAGIAILLSRREQASLLLQLNVPILLYFAFAALSVFWSDYSFITFKHWTKGITDVLMVLVVATEADPVGAMKRVLTRLGFTLVPLSVLLAKYYPGIGRVITASWTVSYAGVTMGKNELGGLCLIVGLGFLWRWLEVYRDRNHPRRRFRLAAFGTVLLMVLVLLKMCQSMTSIASFGIGGMVLWLVTWPRVRRSPFRPHLLAWGAVGFSALALFVVPSVVTVLGRKANLTGRTEIWQGVLSVPDNPLVGAGYESFFLGKRLQEFWTFPSCKRIQEAHDGYLEVYVNLGWIGVSIFALLLATGYKKIMAAYRQAPEIFCLNLAFFISALVHNFTEGQFRMQTLTLIFLFWSIISASRQLATGRSGAADLDWRDRGDRLAELEPEYSPGRI